MRTCFRTNLEDIGYVASCLYQYWSITPQSIIDVLGSAKVSVKTRQYIVETVHGILKSKAVAPILTNSSAVTLNITAALLDVTAAIQWEQVERRHQQDTSPKA